jgi:hypothetical protein
MASDTNLVAVGITKIRTVVVGMVLRPQPGRAFTAAAMGQRNLMSCPHKRPVCGHERHHLPVARMVRLTVLRLADHKKRAGSTGAVPAGPRFVSLAKTKLEVEALHQRAVKVESSIKVAHADEDVGEHQCPRRIFTSRAKQTSCETFPPSARPRTRSNPGSGCSQNNPGDRPRPASNSPAATLQSRWVCRKFYPGWRHG